MVAYLVKRLDCASRAHPDRQEAEQMETIGFLAGDWGGTGAMPGDAARPVETAMGEDEDRPG